MRDTYRRILWACAGAGSIAMLAYGPRARHWYLTFGATDEEVTRVMPGDDLLPDANLVSTRAVTIGTPPAVVWPWLVQLGSGRAGAYTYDWIENLFGLEMHSADEILPQFQHLAVGDVLPLGPDGPAMRVEICEADRTLAFRSEDRRWVWTFDLLPEGRGTRLVSRNRISTAEASPAGRAVSRLIMEPGSLIMERKMLLGIKRRAEVPAGPGPGPSGRGRSALPGPAVHS